MREHLQSKPDYNGASKTPQKWIGSAKTTETSAGNTTFYKYKILASAAKFVILSPSLSLCHVGLCIVIYTTSSSKHWAIESEIAQIRKMKAAEAWFVFEGTSLSCSSSESGSGLGKPGTRPRCCCCCWCGRFPVRSKNTFALAHFGPQPPACTLWFYNRDGWESDSSSPIVIAECPSVSLTMPPDSSTHAVLAWLPPCPLLCCIHAYGSLTVRFLGPIQLLHLVLPNCLHIFKRNPNKQQNKKSQDINIFFLSFFFCCFNYNISTEVKHSLTRTKHILLDNMKLRESNVNIYNISFDRQTSNAFRLKLNNIHCTTSFSRNMELIACTFDQLKLIGRHILVSDSSAPTPISICCSFSYQVTPQSVWKCTSVNY